MPKLTTCVLVEQKKLFKSNMPVMTLLALTLVPFMGGFFMFILKDPSLAHQLGFLSAKAQIAGTADWPSNFSLLAQAIAIGGLMVFGFVMSWIFGREYSDGTIKDLLALPLPRQRIVSAKFIVAALWCMFLCLYVLALSMIVGLFVQLPGLSPGTIKQGVFLFLLSSLLTILLSAPVAFIASASGGYLAPLGFVILTLILAQVVAAIGYGEFFPWSIPALAAGLAGGEQAILKVTSYLIVLITWALGLLSTILWWRYADHC